LKLRRLCQGQDRLLLATRNVKLQTKNSLTIGVAEKPVDDDKDDDHAEAAATKFFCAVTGNQCPKEVVHIKVFAVKKIQKIVPVEDTVHTQETLKR
jgi:hypothetical protein